MLYLFVLYVPTVVICYLLILRVVVLFPLSWLNSPPPVKTRVTLRTDGPRFSTPSLVRVKRLPRNLQRLLHGGYRLLGSPRSVTGRVAKILFGSSVDCHKTSIELVAYH